MSWWMTRLNDKDSLALVALMVMPRDHIRFVNGLLGEVVRVDTKYGIGGYEASVWIETARQYRDADIYEVAPGVYERDFDGVDMVQAWR